jgi:very-short-patch-repair endonuclease
MVVLHRSAKGRTVLAADHIVCYVRASRAEIDRLLAEDGGLIARRGHAELVAAIEWLVHRGELVALLPGVYATPVAAADPLSRMRATSLWEPNAVLTHEAAASLTFWPGIRVLRICCAAPTRTARRNGWQISRRSIPAELIVERRGLRCTAPAVTALDLVDTHGGDAIDTLLRSRQGTLEDLHMALTSCSGRRGNAQRRQLLIESRTNPWSAAERRAHRLLHQEGIEGWTANYPIAISGYPYWVDIAFPAHRLAIEIDGREFHEGAEVFESDRYRQNDLINAGWRVLRFTPHMLAHRPAIVVATIRRALQSH